MCLHTELPAHQAEADQQAVCVVQTEPPVDAPKLSRQAHGVDKVVVQWAPQGEPCSCCPASAGLDLASESGPRGRHTGRKPVSGAEWGLMPAARRGSQQRCGGTVGSVCGSASLRAKHCPQLCCASGPVSACTGLGRVLCHAAAGWLSVSRGVFQGLAAQQTAGPATPPRAGSPPCRRPWATAPDTGGPSTVCLHCPVPRLPSLYFCFL